MTEAAYEYVIQHRFGKVLVYLSVCNFVYFNLCRFLQFVEEGSEVIQHLKEHINPNNLNRYMLSFFHRSDVVHTLTHLK